MFTEFTRSPKGVGKVSVNRAQSVNTVNSVFTEFTRRLKDFSRDRQCLPSSVGYHRNYFLDSVYRAGSASKGI
jgi:hypothetical protein